MTYFLLGAIALGMAVGGWVWRKLRRWNASLWLPAYIRGGWAGNRERAPEEEPVHVLFCIADHFEPGWNDAGPEEQRRRVNEWTERYPRLADQFRDSDGNPPQHTFFFPAEQYRSEMLEELEVLVRDGYGEVEVHLHHEDDTPRGFRSTIQTFVQQLTDHGMLGRDGTAGEPRFGFIHGDWALDNSLPGGAHCGVNGELQILSDCGCYADFTLPAAPSAAQTRRINSIYYVEDDPDVARSHDDGREVTVGGDETGDLMLIQGPLDLMWPGGRFWVLPRPENSLLPGGVGLTRRRVDSWIGTHVCVSGRPEWVFVKLHAHGCPPENREQLLGPAMEAVHRYLAQAYNDGENYRLHYVTAREMYNIAKAAEQGESGDPDAYRDFCVAPPPLAANNVYSRESREVVRER